MAMGDLAREDDYGDPDPWTNAKDALLPPPYDPRGARGTAMGEFLGRLVTTPRKAVGQGVTTEEAIPWAADLAMTLGGGGSMRAGLGGARGQVGSAGGDIRAYHSSPYDFERFDASKIGTGEGAQAYGYGHYFAENPAVSGRGGEYWKNFTYRLNSDERLAVDQLQRSGFDRQAAIAASQNNIAEIENLLKSGALSHTATQNYSSILQNKREAHALLAGDKPILGPRTYEVNIKAKPEQFLDWDAPLMQQQPIADKVRSLVPKPMQKSFELKRGVVEGGDFYRQWIPSQTFPIRNSVNAPWRASGAKSYDEALAMVGGNKALVNRVLTPNSSAASQALREAGIPGIKYLDQGSRAAFQSPAEKLAMDVWRGDRAEAIKNIRLNYRGKTAEDAIAFLESGGIPGMRTPAKQTSNYVVFPGNEDLIAIMRKYGLAGAAPAMGALAAQDRYQ